MNTAEKRKKILLIIPAYNEEKSIVGLLDNLRNSNVLKVMDVLIINDGSKDKTAQVVKDEGFEIISQVYNLGYGAALQTGYKYAFENDYEYLLQMDADGQHDVRNLGRILEKLLPDDSKRRIPDIVIGTRFLEGSETFYVSKLKLVAINLFRRAIKITTGYNITDPTSGLMGLNRRAFGHYSVFLNFDTKYPDINMIIQMLLRGFHIEEIPAIMHERKEGTSMHDGLFNVARYMFIMSLSTLNVYSRSLTERKIWKAKKAAMQEENK